MLRSMSLLTLEEQFIYEVEFSHYKRFSMYSKILYKGVIKVFEKLHSNTMYSGKLKNA